MHNKFTIQIELENNGISILDISPYNEVEYRYDIHIQFDEIRKYISCGFFRTPDGLAKIIDKCKESLDKSTKKA